MPEVVAVVDADGNLLAFLRMDGAKLLSGRARWPRRSPPPRTVHPPAGSPPTSP
ncbi:hypothetical protein [Methylobacterium sp. WL1]|uniref:hypothetical protein n=1 Tax=Methylobacterium sp. WL1 TaxID=2603276 RepID=UPI0032B1D003